MSFREDMIKMQNNSVQLIEERPNVINVDNYKALYNCIFPKLKEKLIGNIKNRYIHYDNGFFSKKNPRYEVYVSVYITVYPYKTNEFYTGINVYNRYSGGLYGDGVDWTCLNTAYLDDVKKSLLYLVEQLKLDKIDYVLVAEHNPELYLKSGYTGEELTLYYIDGIISNMQEQWKKNMDVHYTRCSSVMYKCDIIVQIKCDWDGNIS